MLERFHIQAKDRKTEILVRLFNRQVLSYQKLSDEFFVSRSSIANDFLKIKQFLSCEGLQLCYSNQGTSLEGEEIAIQQSMLRLFTAEGDFQAESIPNDLYEMMETIVSSVKSTRFVKSQATVIQLSIFILRRLENFHILLEEVKGTVEESREIVTKVCEAMEKLFSVQLTEDEKRYITGIFINADLIENQVCLDEWNCIADLSIDLLEKALNIPLSQDGRLKQDLSRHFALLAKRQRYFITTINPLAHYIQSTYHYLFAMIRVTLDDELSKVFRFINSDEWSYITIYIQSAIERYKINAVGVVCPNGAGISSFIISKLEKYAPRGIRFEVLTLEQLEQVSLEKYQLILTTEHLPFDNPMIHQMVIFPMMLEKEKQTILDELHRIRTNQMVYEETQFLFDCQKIERFACRSTQKTVQGVIEEVINTYCQDEVDPHQLVQSALDREQKQSTYLGNGFAIPHANPGLVTHSKVFFIKLEQPIAWKNDKVDIVALLLVSKDDLDELRLIMNDIVNGVENKTKFMATIWEDTHESIRRIV